MKSKKQINYFISLVWILNGFFFKVLNLVPRHEQIVSKIFKNYYSESITFTIGILEMLMAVWILSGYKSKVNAITQIVIILTMNIIEFLLVSDLLMWGKLNLMFALLFIGLIYYNEFSNTNN